MPKASTSHCVESYEVASIYICRYRLFASVKCIEGASSCSFAEGEADDGEEEEIEVELIC